MVIGAQHLQIAAEHVLFVTVAPQKCPQIAGKETPACAALISKFTFC